MVPIGEVARRAGLKPSALRYYERIGLLPPPVRAAGRRRYGDDVLLRLEVIRFARASGFTLGEIRRLFAGRPYSTRLRAIARDKIVELEGVVAHARTMQRLLAAALRCRCLTLEECGRRLRRSAADGRLAAILKREAMTRPDAPRVTTEASARRARSGSRRG